LILNSYDLLPSPEPFFVSAHFLSIG
jgi:hypothetical protein